MKRTVVALMACAGALVLTGCGTSMQANPEFRRCANSCTQRQDACMVAAGTTADVSRCNAGLDSCVSSCEKKYPRYIQPR